VALETQIRQAIRDALTRPSRKPLQWGGLAGYQQLVAVQAVLADVHQAAETGYLRLLAARVQRVIDAHQERAADLARTHEWLHRIAACLAPPAAPPGAPQPAARRSGQVRAAMEGLLAEFGVAPAWQPAQAALERSWRRLWRTWGPQLLYCYDVAGLPADNMQLEGVFGQLRRAQRRISGCKSTAPLRELGQCQILLRAGSQEELLEQLQSVDVATYREQRRRLVAGEAGRQQLRRLHHDPCRTIQELVDRHTARREALTTAVPAPGNTD